MRHSYLTAKMFEILMANGLIEHGHQLPIKNLSLLEFFEQFRKTGRIQNLEAIHNLKDIHVKDIFTMLYLDVPVAIYDESENRIYYIFRKEKEVILVMPIMMGLQNRFQIYSTDKALAEEIKGLGESVSGEEVFEKYLELEKRIKTPSITKDEPEVPVELAPKTAVEKLLESGALTSAAHDPKPVDPDSKKEGNEPSDNLATTESIRKLVEDNNGQDSQMRDMLAQALKAKENRKK